MRGIEELTTNCVCVKVLSVLFRKLFASGHSLRRPWPGEMKSF